MIFLENDKKVFCSFMLRFYIQNESGQYIKSIEKVVSNAELNIIPEINDLIRVKFDSEYEFLGSIPNFKYYKEIRYDFKGKNKIIRTDSISSYDYRPIIIYQNLLVRFDKMNIRKYLGSTLSTFRDVDKLSTLTNNFIKTLSLDDIIDIYLKTMEEGISISLIDYDI